jgi:GNAT superfamily N-acetyltransferase
MWRTATAADHDTIVEMCLAYYAEDPGLIEVMAEQVRQTLVTFERQPWRGQAVVAEEEQIVGYALLVPFYSNELGGAVCEVDELFVRPTHRGEGLGTALFEVIDDGRFGSFVGIALGVTRRNERGRRLYERLGFRIAGFGMLRTNARPR